MKKVVLVEDEDMLRKSLAFFLNANGFEVIEFDNGEDAIEYVKENSNSIEIVITDLNLPFAGGKQVLFAMNDLNHIKKVVLTAQSIESNELEVFDLGADEFISKPFSPQVLLKRIEKLMLLK